MFGEPETASVVNVRDEETAYSIYPGLNSMPTLVETALERKTRFIRQCCKLGAGSILAVFTGVSWAASTYLAQSSLSSENDFSSPTFMVYFATTWNLITYPTYILYAILGKKLPDAEDRTLKDIACEDFSMFKCSSTHHHHPSSLGVHLSISSRLVHIVVKLIKFVIITMLLFASDYTYIRALTFLPSYDVAMVFLSSGSFTYLLAWTVLHEKFISSRIIAFLLSACGIILLAYAEGFGTRLMSGTLLTALSAGLYAVHKILFKSNVDSTKFGSLSAGLSLLGVISVVTLWPLLLFIALTKVEGIVWDRVPWIYVLAFGGLRYAFTLLFNFGEAFSTSPLVTLGLLISPPACAACDILWQGKKNLEFTSVEIAASVLVLLSYLLLHVPDSWHIEAAKILGWKGAEDSWRGEAAATPRAILKASRANVFVRRH